ncbi:MurR/RpiR family transcriptional regulator [Mycoplasmopsis felis]|uniref:MurR/RpiR family transcriptional regulator n=1 Tax=Mycoplasmopsis felis TaxID=33923 RepID=UPI002AFE5B29|nr:MurR/RpiR family transcriptional regulator [Mycoplasmopsis felis]WQQ03143.1 MurR/RpiR family transcriptional regulator [Mycoplasmopsis felis]
MKFEIFDESFLNQLKIKKKRKVLNNLIDYIENETDKFLQSNTLQISETLKVSQSALSRNSKFLGFKNLQELKLYVARKTQYLKDRILEKENQFNTVEETFKNIMNHYLFAIEKTAQKILETHNVEKYIKTLLDFKIQLVFGVGESGIVAKYFSTSLRKIGFNVIFADDIHTFFSFGGLLQLKKVHVTLISRSMNTLEIKNILKYLNENDLPYSVWTRNTELSFKKASNVLYIDSINQTYRISSLGSKISTFFLSDVIFSYLSKKIDKNRKIFSSINDYINNWNSLLPNVNSETNKKINIKK